MFEEIRQAVFEGAVAGLGLGAKHVAELARQKAPVRRIFADGGYNIRFKSIDEIMGDRSIRAQLGLGPERSRGPYRARTTFGRHPPVHWRERRMSAAQGLLENYDAEMVRRKDPGYLPEKTMLTSRGAYEVRSERAVASSFQHRNIGGRLRGSISSSPPSVSGSRAEAWVTASAPYAKYMEFGTRHNAAHPFLRPAAEEARSDVVRQVAEAVNQAIKSGTTAEIEIVVRI